MEVCQISTVANIQLDRGFGITVLMIDVQSWYLTTTQPSLSKHYCPPKLYTTVILPDIMIPSNQYTCAKNIFIGVVYYKEVSNFLEFV